MECNLLIPAATGQHSYRSAYWLSLVRPRGKEWLSLTLLAGRGFLQLFALIADESPVWPLFTGRLPNFLPDSSKVIPIQQIWQTAMWLCRSLQPLYNLSFPLYNLKSHL